ncbi:MULTISPECIES: hypothetical protein [unclassified Mesorhizobium]|uniref:hypothetical protein n=1 Tax=unclassified Mesorhizobium TaxID=325217 RepID=UPI000FCB4C36|nr:MULTISPECIES: hypothetical protein [unclassified Mesorhizobium]RUT88031.1 hypothetical protein EOD14_08340 [Mesorhizobium sp. M7A.T.Ca.US.000.02.1.1]RUT90712.1 hypothetical protein EOD15_17725 [Mesorhizobium sp. M7A.T.Ca.US.000.02.2.1]
MKRILHGLLAVWPPLALASISFGLAASTSPSLIDMGIWDNIAAYGAGLVFMTDVGARYAEFRKARAKIAEFEGSPALGTVFYQLGTYHKRSWCQRTALRWAATDVLGPRGGMIVTLWYKALGYRWWHVLPDGTFSRQSPFLKAGFWSSVVGVKA